MKKIVFLNLVFVSSLVFCVEAKTYVNTEYNYSVWLPEEAEYVYEAPAGSSTPVKFRAEYKGLNLSVMAAHTPNVKGQNFNDLVFTQEYLEVSRQAALSFGSDFEGYYNCPVSNHYYAIGIVKQPNHVSATLFTEIHGDFIQLTAYGPPQYEGLARKIMESFRCLRE